MNEKNLRRLSYEDAQRELSLSFGENGLFFLPNILIQVLSSSVLEITYTNSATRSTSEGSLKTSSPFEYHWGGRKYLLRAFETDLVIDEVETIIGSSQS